MGHTKNWILPLLSTALLGMVSAQPVFAQDCNKTPQGHTFTLTTPSANCLIGPMAVRSLSVYQPIRFESFPAPSSHGFRRFLDSQTGQGYLYLTRHHESFYTPVAQPPTSLPDWNDRLIQR